MVDALLKSINADSASAYQKFCSEHNLRLNTVPLCFHSNEKINISEINGVHSQLEVCLNKFRSVSIKHLQKYLNWFTYAFIMRKRFNLNKFKTESFSNIGIDSNYINSNKIFL